MEGKEADKKIIASDLARIPELHWLLLSEPAQIIRLASHERKGEAKRRAEQKSC